MSDRQHLCRMVNICTLLAWRRWPLTKSAIAVVLALVQATAFAQARPVFNAPRPLNLDFEKGEPGKIPQGWTLPPSTSQAGYLGESTTDRPKHGKNCAVLYSTRAVSSGAYGKLEQTIDAAPFRGKLIRFSAAVRTEINQLGSWAGLSLRVDRDKGNRGFFDDMFNRPIYVSDWGRYEIVGDVATDARSITFGILLQGEGKAWIDNASIEVLPLPRLDPQHTLSDRGLSNLISFVRLLGYVRYFHPSDQAQQIDWERLALWGVKKVEAAKDASQLAATLNALFHRVAPTVRIFPTSSETSLSKDSARLTRHGKIQVVRWQHRGLNMDGDAESIYRSERIREEVSGTTDVTSTFSAGLEGGISVRVPLSVLADERGTLPHARSEALLPGAGISFYSATDRAARLATVALLWNVPQHFYPYFDVVEVDWRKALTDSLRSAATDKDEEEFFDTMRRLAAALQDGHAVVITLDTRRSRAPVTWDWVQGELVVVRAESGESPLHAGDVVLKINGVEPRDAIKTAKPLVSGSTPQALLLRALLEIGSGKKDSQLTLNLMATSDKTYSVSLSRKQGWNALSLEDRPAKVAEVGAGIYYVDVQRSAADFSAALPRLATARGVVFDVRGYPFAVDDILSHLIEKPITGPQFLVPLVTRPDQQDFSFEVRPPRTIVPQEPYLRAKTVFLMDARAGSRSETLLSFVADNHLGPMVGGPTAGTNGNINWIRLPMRYRVGMTGMKTLRKDGSRFHGIGLAPTVHAERTREGIAQRRDEVLERGVEVLEEMLRGTDPLGWTSDTSRERIHSVSTDGK